MRYALPFGILGRGEDALNLIQLLLVLNIKLVDEDRGAGAAVGSDRVDTVYHITPHFQGESGSCLQSCPRILRLS